MAATSHCVGEFADNATMIGNPCGLAAGPTLHVHAIDKTGLAGRFDFHISWGAGGFGSADVGRPDDAPSIFTTVQEQLGLKLMPSKGPVQVVVIDHVERPTEN